MILAFLTFQIVEMLGDGFLLSIIFPCIDWGVNQIPSHHEGLEFFCHTFDFGPNNLAIGLLGFHLFQNFGSVGLDKTGLNSQKIPFALPLIVGILGGPVFLLVLPHFWHRVLALTFP